MRAISQRTFGGPEVLELVEKDRPEPGAGEVLVRVEAAGVNPADYKIRSGAIPIFGPPPFVLGLDVSGVVAGGAGFAVGDEVYGLPFPKAGAYAEYLTAPAETLALKPKTIDHTAAAGLPTAALTCWQAFELASVSAGQRVLVQAGAGGLGHLGIQLAKLRGAYVIATARAVNHDFVRGFGADEVIDYTETDIGTLRDIDVVLENAGGEAAVRSLRTVKRGGWFLGIAGPDIGVSEEEAVARGVRFSDFHVAPSAEDLAAIATLVDDGKLRVHVEHVLPLAEAAKAHELLETNRTRGKIILAG
ncbi:NADP-dependent oxidoreductase [Fodinicola acaciae]|uniref:NADP-dependent oxidoreductase n=1 Tax=Fodinicola acaciae TaxID=2681555 RepID=UPI001652B072|nr:NADP-dependent oxidoreductase [Fodinicola acaciae]